MAPAKKKGEKSTQKLSKWYTPDDEKVRLVRRQNQNAGKTAKLRKTVTAGTVVILLAGRFRGKRVVVLKQLKSGLLLVTGPYKVNGVPLKRVNQTFVQPTSTKVDVSGVDVKDVDDCYFAKTQPKGAKKSETSLFTKARSLSEQQKTQEDERKKTKKTRQANTDKPLLAVLKKTEFLAKYLSSRFTINNAFRPHEARF